VTRSGNFDQSADVELQGLTLLQANGPVLRLEFNSTELDWQYAPVAVLLITKSQSNVAILRDGDANVC
jgi:hypothetical protein